MCGIAGFYNSTVDQSQIDRLIIKLRHRGPDEQRYYTMNDVGLIHTRLSIIEIGELGSQPFRFENLVLVLNGELYNYKEVRQELKTQGYSFYSNSDTEVLIKAFHCWREECVNRFIGMFAFSVYDEDRDEMHIFRDRVGVKPLYYSYVNHRLYFASELKALAVFDGNRDINGDAISLYFRFGFIPDNLSIYNAVSKLEPGHFLTVNRNGITKKRYWHVNYEPILDKKEEHWMEDLEEILISAFTYRMVSDVPVGVFLSGGIDSSLLAGVLQKHHGNIRTFTIGFSESEFDESPYAKKVADHLQVTNTQKTLKLEEARVLLNEFYSIYDEPFADTSGIPTACVTLLAKEQGMKVVLSADGGDELFGGYTHYQKANALLRRFSTLPDSIRYAISKTLRKILPAASRRNISYFNIEHKAYALEELMETTNPLLFYESFMANQTIEEISNLLSLSGLVSMGFSQPIENPIQSMMAWDFQYFLPGDLLVKVDRATMYYGIECREPFLDHRLVELAARMPVSLKMKDGNKKYPLRKLLSSYLPDDYFHRKKQGFSIPIFSWFSKDFDDMFASHLSASNLKKIDVLNVAEVTNEYEKYQNYKRRGKPYNIEKMWRILSFVLWWEKYMKNGA